MACKNFKMWSDSPLPRMIVQFLKLLFTLYDFPLSESMLVSQCVKPLGNFFLKDSKAYDI